MKHIYSIKTITLLCLGIYLCVICLSSCASKANDVEVGCIMPDLPSIKLEDLNTCKTNDPIEVNLPEGTHTIVQTQQRFEELVISAKCFERIDFSKYDLVIGKKQLTNNLAGIKYELSQSCESHTLTVTLKQGMLTVAPPMVTYHLLIPKININPHITIQVEN